MLREIVASYAEGWIVKRETDNAPHRISEDDIAFLTELLTAQTGRDNEAAITAVISGLTGWVVQRVRGQRPAPLGTEQIRDLLAMLAPAALVETGTFGGAAEDDAVKGTNSENDVPADPVSVDSVVAEREAEQGFGQRARETPPQTLYEGLDLARFHIENGV